MRFTKTEKKNHSIISAACLSLTIHFIVGALLVFSLSNNLITPLKLNGLNLVWVCLDTKIKNNGVAIKNTRAKQSSVAMEKIAKIKTDIEKAAGAPETSQIYAAATKESINNITPAKYDTSGTGTKEQPDNITGSSANKTAGEESNLSTVIAYPLYKENAPPVYPEIARLRGYEGIVLVFAEILPDGRVGKIKIGKSSGYAILDQSAIQAVKPWRFEPAKKSGNPFAAWVELPIKFILHNNSSQS
jgi:TonB family protein